MEKMKPNVKEDTVIERVKMYVAHDMVIFLWLIIEVLFYLHQFFCVTLHVDYLIASDFSTN
jgi:hypothetical protein